MLLESRRVVLKIGLLGLHFRARKSGRLATPEELETLAEQLPSAVRTRATVGRQR
jgi:hypothetical protein